MAEERTLLTMKCAAARTEEGSHDIRLLAAHRGGSPASRRTMVLEPPAVAAT